MHLDKTHYLVAHTIKRLSQGKDSRAFTYGQRLQRRLTAKANGALLQGMEIAKHRPDKQDGDQGQAGIETEQDQTGDILPVLLLCYRAKSE
ncbi:hypothetical protein TUM17382_35960 [Shewanella algae]|nr:hypothetical protein TUM17382_35960 [Shewanella algae]